jgi:hypothetical protein
MHPRVRLIELGHRLKSFLNIHPINTASTLLCWWGSIPGEVTIGDLMALNNFSAELQARGHEHTILSHPRFAVEGHIKCHTLPLVKSEVRTLVFVCGPLLSIPRFVALFSMFPEARKLAVGVSVIPRECAINRLITQYVARDGMTPSFFDMALNEVKEVRIPEHDRPLRVGLCFRGRQKDYGSANCKADKAEELLEQVAATISKQPVRISTELSLNTPDHIRSQLEEVDIVFTTRLHGSLLSLGLGKPVIAVDQIVGGAKVLPLLTRIEWPYVLPVEKASEELLDGMVRSILHKWPVSEIVHSQELALKLSRQALKEAAQLVTQTG